MIPIALFLDFDLSITNDIISFKIYDKRDDFFVEILNCPFLDGDPFLDREFPRSPSYGVSISQVIRFAGLCVLMLSTPTSEP